MRISQKKTNSYIEGPYEKFKQAGASYLTDAELLAVILRTGVSGESTVSIAGRVLALSGNGSDGLLGLHHLTLSELMEIRGIGEVKAIKLKCLAELSSRMARAHAEKKLQVRNPSSVADFYMEKLRHLERERVLLVMMDNRNHVIGEQVVSEGTVNSSLISAREIFRTALKCGAVYLILLHNHPGGDPSPSTADIEVTKRIQKASKMMDIPLLDHIIIGDGFYFSFKEKGFW